VEEFAHSAIAPDQEETNDYVASALGYVHRMAEHDLLRYTVPSAYGGTHQLVDIRSLCIIRQGLARHSALADTMFAMQGLGSYPISLAGSEPLKQTWLSKVASGGAIAAFALTEPQAGSDAAGLQSTVRCEPGAYVLDGTKRFISNAGIADFYVVFAKTDPALRRKGISAFVVEKERPGLRMTRSMELIAPHPIGEFQMESCRVPAANLLGSEGEGFDIAMRTLDVFRATVGAAAVGLAERALAEATSYVKSRVQFGKALSEFQGLRFMLAEMATELAASRLLVYQAAWKLDRDRMATPSVALSTTEDDGSQITASSMAKLYATEAGQRIIDRALQIHGGVGVLKGSVVERLYREIRAMRVYEGTSEIQKEIISRQLLQG
jgi:acyl-CoA dehydrogenase